MRRMHRLLVGVLLVVAAALPVVLAHVRAQAPEVPALRRDLPPRPVPGTLLPKAYVETVGRMAFTWGWPLVNMHNRHLVFSKVPEAGLGDGVLPVGPLNRLTMLTDYIKPEERAVATPNQDVVYGFGVF